MEVVCSTAVKGTIFVPVMGRDGLFRAHGADLIFGLDVSFVKVKKVDQLTGKKITLHSAVRLNSHPIIRQRPANTTATSRSMNSGAPSAIGTDHGTAGVGHNTTMDAVARGGSVSASLPSSTSNTITTNATIGTTIDAPLLKHFPDLKGPLDLGIRNVKVGATRHYYAPYRFSR